MAVQLKKPMEGPQFPQFKPLELGDRALLHGLIRDYQPETSELTFTNLFIWRNRYKFEWAFLDGLLCLISAPPGRDPVAFPPLGPGPRVEPVRTILRWLKEERGSADPRIERADARLVSELSPSEEFRAEPVRDHFDYVYRTVDLIELAGSRYHGKRNHLARLADLHTYSYAGLEPSHLVPCLSLAEAWCTVKRCEEDMDLTDELEAIKDSLAHFQGLEIRGGVILIGGKVEAFTLGELLNRRTAVVHVEKANPDIPGLYAAVNQEFCRNEWSEVPFINREQDLGDPGLRQAKLSYRPVRMIEKFTIRGGGA
jgi:hypothetical protein